MSLTALFSSIPASLTDRLGWCALHFLWQGAAIGAGLQLLLLICRRGTAELRHALCGVALLLMAVAPMITWQYLPVPVDAGPRTLTLPDAVAVTDFPDGADLSGLENPQPDATAGHPALRSGTSLFMEDESAIYGRTSKRETASAPLWQHWMGGLWLGGAALMGVWRLCGLWGTFRLIRRAERAAGALLDQVERMARSCGLRRAPLVKITGRLISPAVAGVLRPVLLLPASALAGLSPRELDFVLAHEFAHLRRQDFLTGLLQSLAETILFFHPAVWWVSRRMSFEREQACDDAAMRVTGNRRAGAQALARLAELQLQHTTALAPAAGGGQILARVQRLLEPGRPPQRAQAAAMLPLLLMVAAAAPLLLMPQRAESQTPAPLPSSDRNATGAQESSGADPASPATPTSAPNSDSSQSAASVLEKAAVPMLRGTITDRNGVVLAESVLKEQTGEGLIGTGEIRQYPLGASASHVLGYTALNRRGENAPGPSGADTDNDREQRQEKKIRIQLAVYRDHLNTISKLEKEQRIEAALSFITSPAIFNEPSVQWRKNIIGEAAAHWRGHQSEVKRLTGTGLRAGYPELELVAAAMRSEKAVLEAIAENNRDALANYIGKLEAPTESQVPEDREPILARLRKKLKALSGTSGARLIEDTLYLGLEVEVIKQLAGHWKRHQVEYAMKMEMGSQPGDSEVSALSEAMQKEEAILNGFADNLTAALKLNVKNLSESLARSARGASTRTKELLGGVAGMEKALDSTLLAVPAPDGKPQPAAALTLDARIQRISENALRDAGVGRGAAVVLDVANGDILAMASVPDFDPNQLVPFEGKSDWSKLNSDATQPLMNRALAGNSPGSTFKLITAIAAGDTGKWRTSFNCSGTVTYGGRPFSCWTVKQHVAPHGTLGLSDALKCSCNCWFYQAGNATGIDTISAVAGKFGLGLPSNSGLDQGINTSFMPSPVWWATQNKGPWTSAKTALAAIGQGEVLATPLQMASVAAAVANNGKIWRQHIVNKSLVNGVWQAPTAELEHDLLAEGTPAGDFEAIRMGMWKAVNENESTGKLARSAIVTMAGKTGTAQVWRRKPGVDENAGNPEKIPGISDNHTWFIGFAPFEKPRYAFAILVGNGKAGGTSSAPIARRIMESVELMNRGKLNVDLSPLAAAKGNFNFVESVEYKEALPTE